MTLDVGCKQYNVHNIMTRKSARVHCKYVMPWELCILRTSQTVVVIGYITIQCVWSTESTGREIFRELAVISDQNKFNDVEWIRDQIKHWLYMPYTYTETRRRIGGHHRCTMRPSRRHNPAILADIGDIKTQCVWSTGSTGRGHV